MTAKEKAMELIRKFEDPNLHFTKDILESAKHYALICVGEMQEHAQMVEGEYEGYSDAYQFLLNVEQQINKL